jgi:hypothetical protein
MKGCTIRGTSLDGILGVDCLRGVSMPWGDVLDSRICVIEWLFRCPRQLPVERSRADSMGVPPRPANPQPNRAITIR